MPLFMALFKDNSAGSLFRLVPRILRAAAVPAFFVLACAQAQLTAEGGIPAEVAVRGVVLSLADHQPIGGATVRLFLSHRTTITDDQGRFEFGGVPREQNEQLSVNKDGYLCMLFHSGPMPQCTHGVEEAVNEQMVKARNQEEARQILTAGVVNVTLTMMPAAVIRGRIVDQHGQPVAGLMVGRLTRRVRDGRAEWTIEQASGVKTDANGTYRMDRLEPGDYLLRTGARAGLTSPLKYPGSPFELSVGYPAVWYPGASTQEGATVIHLAPGAQQEADFTVRPVPFHLINIPFVWNRADATGSVGFGLSGDEPIDSFQVNPPSNQHNFQAYVPNGTYTFGVTLWPPQGPQYQRGAWSDGSQAAYSGSEQFTVDDRTISAPAIPVAQPVDIAVHVHADLKHQDERKASVRQYEVYAPPVAAFKLENGGYRFNNTVNWSAGRPEDSLVFHAVPPGTFHLASVAMNDSYIASLTCGDLNLLRDPLVVGPGHPACAIEAEVRDDMATVMATVTPAAQQQMEAAHVEAATLVLLPLDRNQPSRSDIVRPRGTSRGVKVPPGQYLALLTDGRDLAWREPGERARLEVWGKVVTLAPDESASVTLDWRAELNDPAVKGPRPRVSTFWP